MFCTQRGDGRVRINMHAVGMIHSQCGHKRSVARYGSNHVLVPVMRYEPAPIDVQ